MLFEVQGHAVPVPGAAVTFDAGPAGGPFLSVVLTNETVRNSHRPGTSEAVTTVTLPPPSSDGFPAQRGFWYDVLMEPGSMTDIQGRALLNLKLEPGDYSFSVADTIPPRIVHSVPAANAVGVPVSTSSIVLEFNEPVRPAVGGRVVLTPSKVGPVIELAADDNSLVVFGEAAAALESPHSGAAATSPNGTDARMVVTIWLPVGGLITAQGGGQQYHVEFQNGAIQDLAGWPLEAAPSLYFEVADIGAPTIISTIPAVGSIGADGSLVELNFDEPVTAGAGLIRVHGTTTGDVFFRDFNITSPGVVTIEQSTVRFLLGPPLLAPGTLVGAFQVVVPAGGFLDASSNPCPELTDAAEFTLADPVHDSSLTPLGTTVGSSTAFIASVTARRELSQGFKMVIQLPMPRPAALVPRTQAELTQYSIDRDALRLRLSGFTAERPGAVVWDVISIDAAAGSISLTPAGRITAVALGTKLLANLHGITLPRFLGTLGPSNIRLESKRGKLLDVLLNTSVGVATTNDYPPRFAGAPYAVTVPEVSALPSPAGQITLLKITAVDPDHEFGRAVRYSLVQMNLATPATGASPGPKEETSDNPFEIDPISGILVLRGPLDYDSLRALAGEPAVIVLTVKATEESPPFRAVTTTISVTVSDKNDNPPQFVYPATATQVGYRTFVFDESAVGVVVLTLVATDADSGGNGELRFSLDTNGGTAEPESFSVDPETGEVILERTLLRSRTPFVWFPVIAIDNPTGSSNGQPQLNSSAVVAVDVIDRSLVAKALLSVQIPSRLEPTAVIERALTSVLCAGDALCRVAIWSLQFDVPDTDGRRAARSTAPRPQVVAVEFLVYKVVNGPTGPAEFDEASTAELALGAHGELKPLGYSGDGAVVVLLSAGVPPSPTPTPTTPLTVGPAGTLTGVRPTVLAGAPTSTDIRPTTTAVLQPDSESGSNNDAADWPIFLLIAIGALAICACIITAIIMVVRQKRWVWLPRFAHIDNLICTACRAGAVTSAKTLLLTAWPLWFVARH